MLLDITAGSKVPAQTYTIPPGFTLDFEICNHVIERFVMLQLLDRVRPPVPAFEKAK